MGFIIIIMSGTALINQILLLAGHKALITLPESGHEKNIYFIPFYLLLLLFGILGILASFSPKGTDENNKNGKDGDDDTG